MAPMGRFHWITILVAVVVLLIVLIYVGILMTHGSKAALAYPPIANSCPDFWLTDLSGNCVVPGPGSKNAPTVTLSTNQKNKTSYTPGFDGSAINFNAAGWVSGGTSAICAKQTWCRQMGVAWDGIDNYNNCSS